MNERAKGIMLIVLILGDVFICQIHRGKFTRFGYFLRPFKKDLRMNVNAIETHNQVEIAHACVKLCINHPECSSINYNTVEFVCELLDKDRRYFVNSHLEDKPNIIYMDSRIYYDPCGKENKCFPCKCRPGGLIADANECDCTMFSSNLQHHADITIFQIQIHSFDHTLHGNNDFGIYNHNMLPNWDVWHLSTARSASFFRIYRYNSMLLYFVITNFKVYYFYNEWIAVTHDSQPFIHIYAISNYILAIGTDGNLYKDEGSLFTYIVKGPITAIQEHRGYWYAIGKECKCILKHEKITSTESFTWMPVTPNPGSCVQFKINFNDVIYARFEDGFIYEWDEIKQEWFKTNVGPCIDFDVLHYIACVTPGNFIVSNWHTIPRPNIHIPFKTYNETGHFTPYAIGQDSNGLKHMEVGSVNNAGCSGIVLDQFGKGNVLHTSDKNDSDPCVFGNFDDSRFTLMDNNEDQFTISAWFRLTKQSFQSSTTQLFATSNGEKGINVYTKNTDTDASITMTIRTSQYALESSPTTTANLPFETFYYWTFIDIRFRKEYAYVSVWVNGTLRAHSTQYTNVAKEIKQSLVFYSKCIGCYISELSVWYTVLSVYQTMQMYHQETPFKACYLVKPDERVNASCSDPNNCFDDSIFGANFCFINAKKDDTPPPSLLPENNRVTATSCKHLLEQNTLFEGKGYYWIMLNGQMKSVYCDMTTDGGGWTLISSFSYDKLGAELQSSFLTDAFTNIDMTYTNAFVLSAAGFLSLKEITNFRQLRYHCTSGLHSRVVDIATKGVEILEFLLKANTPIPDPCKTYYRLPDDTSEIFTICNDVKFIHTLQSSDEKLYGSFSGSMQRIAFGVRSFFLCDSEGGVANSGKFKVYIR